MNTQQAYQTLELDRNASLDTIKNAYRKLALESHPDKNSNEQDGLKFKKVTEAYHVLKKHYETGTAKYNSRRQEPKPQWGAPPKDNPPEEDWGKFTKEFEEGDPTWWKEYEKKFWEEYDKTINADGKNGEFEKTAEPKKQPDLLVDVDQSLCIGCCSCEIIAPNVFHIDKKTQTNPKSKVINARGAGINKIMNAAETCPTKAINVNNKDTKERLFPY